MPVLVFMRVVSVAAAVVAVFQHAKNSVDESYYNALGQK